MPLKSKPIELEFDLFDETLLNTVVANYDVGNLLEANSVVLEGDRIVILGEKTQTSRKMAVETSKGRYFLKQIPWYCDDLQSVAFSHKLTIHLAQAGLPVPRLLTSSSGTTWIEIKGSKFTLTEYIAGNSYQGKTAENQTIAQTLAKIHLAGSQCNFDVQSPHESLPQIVASHINLARQQPTCTPGVSRILDTLEAYCQQSLIIPESLPLFPVHGDFIPWNIAFHNNEVTAIYDFDNCCMDSRLHDLGEAIVAFFALDYLGQSSQLRKGIRLNLPVKETHAFLQNYQAISRLSNLELKWLPVHVLGAWWESILLSFIRCEQDEHIMQQILGLPGIVSDWWNQLNFTHTL